MSWGQWASSAPPAVVPGLGINPGVSPVVNPAPAVLPPSTQYTPEQWAQMQQQNWQQWAQWQQQYQQWHQQYGAEYQKSVNALSQAMNTPVPNTSVPPPLPKESKPPLPPEEPPLVTPTKGYTTGINVPPHNYNTAPPPTQTSYKPAVQGPQISYRSGPLNQQQPSYQTAPPPNQQPSYTTAPPSNQQPSFNPPQQNQQQSYNTAPPKSQPSYNTEPQNQQFNTGPPSQPFKQGQPYNQGSSNQPFNQGPQNQSANYKGPMSNQQRNFNYNPQNRNPNWQKANQGSHGNTKAPPSLMSINIQKPGQTSQSPGEKRSLGTPDHQDSKKNKFEEIGKSNQNYLGTSSDANPLQVTDELSENEKKFIKQFTEWEAQFNKWKEQNVNHPDKEQYREYEKKWEAWRTQLLERREQMRRKRLGLVDAKSPVDVTKQAPISNPQQAAAALIPNMTKPPPNMNNEPLEFAKKAEMPLKIIEEKTNTIEDKANVDFEETKNAGELEDVDNGSTFLKLTSSEGIPGLDLVMKDAKDEGKGNTGSVIDLEKDEEKVNKGPDLEAISKGINNILGDPKLLSMLSMVTQNQNFQPPSVTDTTSKMQIDTNLHQEDSNQNVLNKQQPDSFIDQRSNYNLPQQDSNQNVFNKQQDSFIDQRSNYIGGQESFDRNVNRFEPPDYFREPANRFAGANVNDRFSDSGRHEDSNFKQQSNFRGPNTFDDFKRPDAFGETSTFRGDNCRRPGNFGGPNTFRETDNYGEPDAYRGPDSFRENNDFNKFRGRDNFSGPGNFNRGPDNFRESNNFRGPDNFRGSQNFRGPNNFNNRGSDNFRGPGNFSGPNNFRGADNFGGSGRFNEPENFSDDNFGDANNFGGLDKFRGPNNLRESNNSRGFNNSRQPIQFRGSDGFKDGSGSNFEETDQLKDSDNNDNYNDADHFEEEDEFEQPECFKYLEDDPENVEKSENRQEQDTFRDSGNFRGPNNFKGSDNFRGQNLNRSGNNFGRVDSSRRPDNFGRPNNYERPNIFHNLDNLNRGTDNFGPRNAPNMPPRQPSSFQKRNDFNGRWEPPDINMPPDNFNKKEETSGIHGSEITNTGEESKGSEKLMENPVVLNPTELGTVDPNVKKAPENEVSFWKPTKVTDYDHKSIKPAMVEVTLEPVHTFDYRHKPVSRIPFPQRPSWLKNTLKNCREFDFIIRPQLEPTYSRYPPVERFPEKRFAENRYEGKYSDSRYLESRYMEDKESRRPHRDSYKRDEGSDSMRKFDDYGPSYNRRSRDSLDSRKDYDKFENDDNWGGQDDDEPVPKKLCDFELQGDSKFKDKPVIENKSKTSSVTLIEDVLNPPGRYNRPARIVIILRGPPGSGKTFLAKLIKDKEVENGGSAPRILSLDDYFMVEQEKEIEEDGKKLKVKEMVYEYEECMEATYRTSLLKAFKKTVTDGYFSFIIVDNVNDKVKYFGEMWSFAKQNGFQVYVTQLELDVQTCTKRNVHNRSETEIQKLVNGWEQTPAHHAILDATGLVQSGSIPEVEMEEINSPPSEDMEEQMEEQACRSKWDNFDCSIDNLAKLDGTNKPLRHSATMEAYLQLEDDWVSRPPTKPGQKRVRWADLEERKEQEKMRAIGFVVGQTNWDRMMDPTMGGSALTQTKYFDRAPRYYRD